MKCFITDRKNKDLSVIRAFLSFFLGKGKNTHRKDEPREQQRHDAREEKRKNDDVSCLPSPHSAHVFSRGFVLTLNLKKMTGC